MSITRLYLLAAICGVLWAEFCHLRRWSLGRTLTTTVMLAVVFGLLASP